MKKAALLTYTPQIGMEYRQTLEEIFANYCSFENYNSRASADKLTNLLEGVDLCILSDSIPSPQNEALRLSQVKIIDLKASFSKEKLDYLLNIEDPIHFIFRYRYLDTCIRVIDIFREYGIKNYIWSHQRGNIIEDQDGYLNMIIKEPFFENEKTYLEDISDHLVYDLGNRRISFDTLMKIKDYLEIDDIEVIKKILDHVKLFSSIDSLNFSIFKQSFISESSLDKVISYMDSCILFLDKDFNITKANDRFKDKFKLREKNNLKEIEDLGVIIKYLEAGKELNNYILTRLSSNKSFIVNSEKLEYMDGILHSSDYMVIIEDMEKVNRKQEIYRSKLVEAGHYAKYSFADILGASSAIGEAIKIGKKMAKIDKTTLIIGETGTGKELFAHSIHKASIRKNKPFVSINCAAIPEDLLESELFGYEPGTFTGARKDGKIGLFETANGGSFFLDEIGELNYDIQSKLLRAIETKEFMRVGGSSLNKVDVRIIAATNRDLVKRVRSKDFREDLYFRLNNFEINIPSLRDRDQDVLDLAKQFMVDEVGKAREISPDLKAFFLTYKWPGNIRELKNVISYMVNIYDGKLCLDNLPAYLKRINQESEEVANREIKTKTGQLHKVSDKQDLYLFILRLLKENEVYSRRSLGLLVLKEGHALTDYKLRKTLLKLRDLALVDYAQGPGKISLTPLGLDLLESEDY